MNIQHLAGRVATCSRRRRPHRQLLARRHARRTRSRRRGAAKPVALTEVDSFLAIDTRRRRHASIPARSISAPASATALAQIVAEELDVPFTRVKLVQGDTALTPDQGTTWGSLTIQIGGMQIRQAAAAARQALLDGGGQEARRHRGRPQGRRRRHLRRRQERHLRRADRRQELRDHARPEAAGARPRTRRTTRSSASR